MRGPVSGFAEGAEGKPLPDVTVLR